LIPIVLLTKLDCIDLGYFAYSITINTQLTDKNNGFIESVLLVDNFFVCYKIKSIES